ncbi:hypothetical protein QF002_002899 [Paraburkholderia youngii]
MLRCTNVRNRHKLERYWRVLHFDSGSGKYVNRYLQIGVRASPWDGWEYLYASASLPVTK